VRETAEVVASQLGELPSGTRLLIGFDVPIVETTVAGVDAPEVDELAEQPEDTNGDVVGADQRVRPGTDTRVAVTGTPVGPYAAVAAVSATIGALRKKGFARLLIDGRAVTIEDVDPQSLRDRTTLQVVVDRVQLNGEDLRQRLTDSIETAYLEGGGAAWAFPTPPGPSAQPPAPILFSERFECRQCGITYEDPQPRLFSFNNPFGACPACHGVGNIIELDMDRVVPDATKSIQQGAIEPWSKPHYRAQLAELKRAARKAKIRLDVPWSDLTDEEKTFVVDGDQEYDGIRGFFRWLE